MLRVKLNADEVAKKTVAPKQEQANTSMKAEAEAAAGGPFEDILEVLKFKNHKVGTKNMHLRL